LINDKESFFGGFGLISLIETKKSGEENVYLSFLILEIFYHIFL
jgi:hypothetical protein